MKNEYPVPDTYGINHRSISLARSWKKYVGIYQWMLPWLIRYYCFYGDTWLTASPRIKNWHFRQESVREELISELLQLAWQCMCCLQVNWSPYALLLITASALSWPLLSCHIRGRCDLPDIVLNPGVLPAKPVDQAHNRAANYGLNKPPTRSDKNKPVLRS